MCACSLIDCYKNTKQCARNPSRSDQDSNGDKSGIHQTFNFRNNNINHGANLTFITNIYRYFHGNFKICFPCASIKQQSCFWQKLLIF